MVPEPQRSFRLHVSRVFGVKSLADFMCEGCAWPSQQDFVQRHLDFTLVSTTPGQQAKWLRVLYKEATQIVERLGERELVLQTPRAARRVIPHLGCKSGVKVCLIPAIPRSALLRIVWTPALPTKPHPMTVHSQRADEEQIKSFVKHGKHLRKILLPIFEDLQFRLAFRLLPVRARFWFLEAVHPRIQYCVRDECDAIETEEHLFFECTLAAQLWGHLTQLVSPFFRVRPTWHDIALATKTRLKQLKRRPQQLKMAPEQVPALLPTEALLAGLKSGSPLRTVLSPAAPERETGGMSPEVGPFESRPEEGDGLEAASGNSESPSMDTGSASNTENPQLLPESQGDDAATPDDDNVNDRGSEGNNNSDDDGDSDDNDEHGVMENPQTVSTVCGYTFRKRTAEQLEAMRPVKRTRRSAMSVETGEIDCIDNRRTVVTGFEYRVTWVDDSDPIWLPRDQLMEDGNANLVETLDAYLLRAFSAVADGEDNACLPHAVQMALELLGHQQESARLPEIWTEYLQNAVDAKVPLNEGFYKLGEIVRCGARHQDLRKNLYDGDGAGPMAIVRRVLPDDKGVRVLKPGVYLVGAYKRNMRAHCFALKVTTDEDMVVRENGVDSGIGDHRWLRMLKFIRRIKVRQNGD
ncbi:hypothetical protein GQ600_17997 [Phytophthora cactorum]|nr:hypothetical protein GQ600_17997 [Phytophthora cactorum]